MNFNKAEFEASYGRLSQLPPSTLPEIAFAGRSNVGKSSMLNKVMGRKSLARVSSVPGKTVTVNFFRVGEVRFADLPGYGYARVSKSEKERWAKLMEGYFRSGRNIRLCFSLIDMRHPPTRDDLVMLSFLRESGIPYALALTKADKLSARQREERLAALREEIPCVGEAVMVPFSAETGMGVEEIRALIEGAVEDTAGQE